MKEKKSYLTLSPLQLTQKNPNQLLNPKAKKLLEHILDICHYTFQGKLFKIPWVCLYSLLPYCPKVF